MAGYCNRETFLSSELGSGNEFFDRICLLFYLVKVREGELYRKELPPQLQCFEHNFFLLPISPIFCLEILE
jgi:hypothetical protein